MSDVNIINLRNGINLWRQNRFDNDFHNSTYAGLQSARSDGFSVRYWEYLVDLLASWRAIRPRTKVEIRARGLERLANIEKEYWRIFKAYGNSEPDLLTAKWYESSISKQIVPLHHANHFSGY
jgi:hypothetical protein